MQEVTCWQVVTGQTGWNRSWTISRVLVTLCYPDTVRQSDVQPCLHARARVCGPRCASDTSGGDRRSIRLPFKCRSALSLERLLALPGLPPAPRTATTPPYSSDSRTGWARLNTGHPSQSAQESIVLTRIYCRLWLKSFLRHDAKRTR